MRTFFLVVVALGALLVAACGGQLPESVPDGSSMLVGRLVFPDGTPVVGADLAVGPHETGHKTDGDGAFFLPVSAGGGTLKAARKGVPLLAYDYEVSEKETLDIGELVIDDSVDEELDEVDAMGNPIVGDGVADALEVIGWDIFVNENGRPILTRRHVTSDPAMTDTDSDGLTDAEELAALTDPRRRDTDGDGLTDIQELRQLKSNPADVDTDGDARGPDGLLIPNPSLFDGNEYLLSKTSPVLADTDGDGLSDFEEILGGGLAPLVADLPQVSIELFGDPNIFVNQTDTMDTTVNTSETFTLEQTDTERVSESTTIRNTFTNETEIKASVEGGGRPASASASASAENTATNVFSVDWNSSTSSESVTNNTELFEKTIDTTTQTRRTDGEFAATFRVRNTGNRGFTISDLLVAAYKVNSGGDAGFKVIDFLDPAPAAGGTSLGDVTLGPGNEFTFLARSGKLSLGGIEPLVRRPSSLYFEMANFTLSQVDDTGSVVRDYAAIGERVLERCGTLKIDFGNGEVYRYQIATNVDRNPDGSSAGLRLTAALERLGFPFASEPYSANQEYVESAGAATKERLVETTNTVLTSVTDERGNVIEQYGTEIYGDDPHAPVAPYGFWAVLTSGRQGDLVELQAASDGLPIPNLAGTPLRGPRSIGDYALFNGEEITLAFLQDRDGDGLYDGEEQLFGTDPDRPDTDGDGLLDGYEVKVRRMVEFDRTPDYLGAADYSVVSNPTLSDTDGDGSDDNEELLRGTDPNKQDTDGDGIIDPLDSTPLDPPAGTGIPTNGLLVHYPFDGPAIGTLYEEASQPGMALNLFGTQYDPNIYPILKEGFEPGTLPYVDRFGIFDRALLLYPRSGGGPDSPYALGPALTFTPNRELTIVAWARRVDGVGQEGDAALVALGGGTRLDARASEGDVYFRVQTQGGSRVVGGETSGNPNAKIVLQKDRWTMITAVIQYPENQASTLYTFRMYKDDDPVPVAEDLDTRASGGEGVPDLSGTLRIGVHDLNNTEGQTFGGAIDDVRIYDRALGVGEIQKIYRERQFSTP